MALDGALNQLNASTRRYIRENPKLVDNVFQQDPFAAYARQNLKKDFTGGRVIGEDFIYAGLIGGSYEKGKEFDITERQVEQQAQFEMKFFEINITLSKEDVQVLNKGPQASYRLVDSRMSAVYLTIGAHIAIALYLNGTRANYTPNFNGLAEALNDNSTASWDNNTYSTYGGLSRAGTNGGDKLVSAPTNVNGTIEYNQLEDDYADSSYGSEDFEPNLGVITNKGYSYVKQKFQTQQRFNDTQDPKIGFNGLKFNNATLIKSRYVPGSVIVDTAKDTNEVAVDYLTEMSNGAITTYPALAVASSETLFWLNARQPYMNFYASNDREYGFGFTGFKPGQGNTKIAGQVLASCALTLNPRYHKQVYGITS